MVYKFHKKINQVNMIHFSLQVSWLAAFVLTLPEQFTRTELITRLSLAFGAYTVVSFGLRHYYVQKAVKNVQLKLHTTEAYMKRLLGMLDDFSRLAEAHVDSIRRVEAPSHTREQLMIQADEMSLRLDKTATDVERMKMHLHYVYLEKPQDESPMSTKHRQYESSYYFR